MPEWAKPVLLASAFAALGFYFRKVPTHIFEWFKGRHDDKIVQCMKSIHLVRIDNKILKQGQPCYVTADEIAEAMHWKKQRVVSSLRRLHQKGIVHPFADYWCLPAHELVN
jgi:hypothetical protein